MSTLILRHSPSEHVLRSVGELPGILGIGHPEGVPTFVIDPHWNPKAPMMKGAGVELHVQASKTGYPPGAEPITVEAAVEACEGVAEARALMNYSIAGLHGAVHYAEANPSYLELVRASADFSISVREALVAAGYLRPEEA